MGDGQGVFENQRYVRGIIRETAKSSEVKGVRQITHHCGGSHRLKEGSVGWGFFRIPVEEVLRNQVKGSEGPRRALWDFSRPQQVLEGD